RGKRAEPFPRCPTRIFCVAGSLKRFRVRIHPYSWVSMKTRQGDGVKRLILVVACACVARASGPDLDRAHKLYSLTEFQQSLEVLQAVPNKNSAVYELMGCNYYGQGEFKKATEVLEKAAALEPESSEIYLWLGRAYGRRA